MTWLSRNSASRASSPLFSVRSFSRGLAGPWLGCLSCPTWWLHWPAYVTRNEGTERCCQAREELRPPFAYGGMTHALFLSVPYCPRLRALLQREPVVLLMLEWHSGGIAFAIIRRLGEVSSCFAHAHPLLRGRKHVPVAMEWRLVRRGTSGMWRRGPPSCSRPTSCTALTASQCAHVAPSRCQLIRRQVESFLAGRSATIPRQGAGVA